jgi:hypothetical protein
VKRPCALVLLLGLALAFGCRRTQSLPPNQQQPSISPNGRYVLTVPIEPNETNPEYAGTRVWKVTISDQDGALLYRDDKSEFVGYLNAYWLWDSQDRVWLYNSDTGQVFFWELSDGEWLKTEWGHGRVGDIDRDLAPPPEVYPSYVP